MDDLTIHIFNPETDYALAMGCNNYSPPFSIVKFRKDMSLFPVTYSQKGDAVVTIDSFSDSELSGMSHYDIAVDKKISILQLNEIGSFINEREKSYEITILPWGWNHTLRKSLENHGVDHRYLKPFSRIDKLRELSHRRTTITFNRILMELLPDINVGSPVEFHDAEEALRFSDKNKHVYYKMPWSSSGRGVLSSSIAGRDEITRWIRGAIRKQGSVIAEIGKERSGDFASEWWCENGVAEFLGFSFFETSEEGRYLGNYKASQPEIEKRISSLSPLWNREIIHAQKRALERIITPFYDGPAGIDMFSTPDGEINPCVEINLRLTMGLAALWQMQRK